MCRRSPDWLTRRSVRSSRTVAVAELTRDVDLVATGSRLDAYFAPWRRGSSTARHDKTLSASRSDWCSVGLVEYSAVRRLASSSVSATAWAARDSLLMKSGSLLLCASRSSRRCARRRRPVAVEGRDAQVPGSALQLVSSSVTRRVGEQGGMSSEQRLSRRGRHQRQRAERRHQVGSSDGRRRGRTRRAALSAHEARPGEPRRSLFDQWRPPRCRSPRSGHGTRDERRHSVGSR